VQDTAIVAPDGHGLRDLVLTRGDHGGDSRVLRAESGARAGVDAHAAEDTACLGDERSGHVSEFAGIHGVRVEYRLGGGDQVIVGDEVHTAEATSALTPAPEHSDPAGLGAQSDLIGAPERISIEAILAVQSIAHTSDPRSAPGLLALWLPVPCPPASVQYSGARLCTLTVYPRVRRKRCHDWKPLSSTAANPHFSRVSMPGFSA
jgi:hypothetical protein